MDRIRVEREVRRLHYEIWHKRALLFPFGEPPAHVMLTPGIAAQVLDLNYVEHDRIASEKDGFEPAGSLDRRRNTIVVSRHFGYTAQRFTGAHEIGHYLLHPFAGDRVAHRDRPLTAGMAGGRPAYEVEADHFAACFLAPARLLRKSFQDRFGREPLQLDDLVAYHLAGARAQTLMRAPTGSLDFAAAVATAQKFDRRMFPALTEQFGMSVTAMAIRLRELGLVAD